MVLSGAQLSNALGANANIESAGDMRLLVLNALWLWDFFQEHEADEWHDKADVSRTFLEGHQGSVSRQNFFLS